MEIVAADIGGTNARFAIAEIDGRRVVSLGEPVTLQTVAYASLATAFQAFAAGLRGGPPRAAAFALATPIVGDLLKMTNNPWVIRPATLAQELGVDAVTLVNDFAAIGHAVAQMAEGDFRHIAGPEIALPTEGVTTIIGPGTGLGVASVLRRNGRASVIPCEGGHIDFAPLDALEDAILSKLRQRFRRVSVERIVSGPGLANIYEALAAIEGRAATTGDDKALWKAAIDGGDQLAGAALDRFCLCFGAVAGDMALVQGASGVAIAGGIAPRIADRLPSSGFSERFVAKGRFERMMASMPVKLITHPQPGLLGVAAAFAEEHGS